MPVDPPPRLIQPSPERLATLMAPAPNAADVAAGSGADPAAPYPKGAADFTTADMFEGFIGECEALETSAEPRKTEDVVYQGTIVPDDLPKMPDDNIFRLMEGNPEFLDPNRVAESAGRAIVSNLFETLVLTAPGNTPPVPGAAERWDRSPDNLTWTFHLRPGMRWTDGQPVTAHDFVYAWKRGLSPELASKNAEQLWFIAGAEAYNTGKVKTADGVAVKALDDLTLEVRLAQPTPFFLDLVTYPAFAPVPRWAIERHGDAWTRVENMVSNGPFTLTKWVERDRFELTKSTTYWDAANVKLAGAIIYHTENEAMNVTLYRTGQSHLARPLGPDHVKKFIQDGRSDLRVAADGCIYYYILRTDRPPFDDARVRRALNLALDKEQLVRTVLGAFQKVATTMVPELVGGFTGYVPPKGPGLDPAAARRLLAEAGFPNGRGLELEISYNTFEGHKRIAEFASKSWGEALGVAVTSVNMEWKSLLKKQTSGDFQISRAGWCPDYPDPTTFLSVFRSDAANNYPAYKNPAFDALLDRIRAEPDARRRNVLMCAAEKGLQRDMPVVPMYQYTRTILLRPEVRGYEAQYQDHHLLKWVSLEPMQGGR
ncbi:MAG: peptide ABC transporter substrate-binding protein [Deltaproteobacteria bacterium]|nr:peptide ABC transporter substrate-binding protein [Deltaproteobacteria bacterium]